MILSEGRIMDYKLLKNPYSNQYVAPYRYAFFNEDGKCLGRVIWVNNVDGIYIDKCDSVWGL